MPQVARLRASAALLFAAGLTIAACGGDDGGGPTSTGAASTGAASTGGGLEFDECKAGAHDCGEHATCVDTPDFYECVCDEGYRGDGRACADVDECVEGTAACDAGASCTNNDGGYACACDAGFKGDGKACSAEYTALAAGVFHTCALRVDGTLWCFGNDGPGRLGLGIPLGLSIERPVQVGTNDGWRKLASGPNHNCAVDAEKRAYCWGGNASAMLGDGTHKAKGFPTRVAGDATDWESVAVGENHSCGLRGGGKLYCWGSGSQGQLGHGSFAGAPVPVAVTPAQTWKQISAREANTCGIRANGTLFCWGQGNFGQAGVKGNTNVPVQVGTKAWSAVATGLHTCAIDAEAALYCWGKGGDGQLGQGSLLDSVVPLEVTPGRRYVAIANGKSHSCAVRDDHQMFCWGNGSGGQLGVGVAERSAEPARVGDASDWASVTAGELHNCGLRNGVAYCWGGNTSGQLGGGTSGDRIAPDPVGPLVKWASVDVAHLGSCAITQGNELYCWGNNSFWQNGDGTEASTNMPTRVGGDSDWRVVARGTTHACGLRGAAQGGDLYCWGLNFVGQLGDGTGQPHATPVAAAKGVKWRSVETGEYHSCGLRADGAVQCWGYNATGQLGDGTLETRAAPVDLDVAAKFKALSTNFNHTCAIREDGALLCWGRNDAGQLGLGDAFADPNEALVNTPAPAQVGAAKDWVAVNAGVTQTCAIKKSGDLYCWGDGLNGVLGFPLSECQKVATNGACVAPTRVGTSKWKGVNAGVWVGCGVPEDGSLECWGPNILGTVGVGDFVPRERPSRVGGLVGWTSVSSYFLHTCGVRDDGSLYCWGWSGYGALGHGKAWTLSAIEVVDP